MLQRLPKELAQVKVGNTSENLRNISPLVVGNEVTSGTQEKFKKKKKKKGKKTFFFAFFTFFTFQGRSYEVNLITVRSLINLSSSPIVIFYVLDNNFLHTQLAFAFVRQKYFFNVHDDTDTFSLFLLQKDFNILGLLLVFGFFLFRKILIPLASFWSHSMCF